MNNPNFTTYFALTLFVVCFIWHIFNMRKAKKQKIANEIFQMMFSMSAGNLSIISAVLQEKEDAEIGTIQGSENDKFYGLMEKIGHAKSVPLKSDLSPELKKLLDNKKSYKLTPRGRLFLNGLFNSYEIVRKEALAEIQKGS